MERYPMALSDEALDVAFKAGALKRVPSTPMLLFARMIPPPSGKPTDLRQR